MIKQQLTTFYKCPAGYIHIKISDGHITALLFTDEEHFSSDETGHLSASEKKILKECTRQFDEYFSGKRKIFDLPLQQTGTGFQHKVWNELMKIPYGKTISYLELAQRLGDVKSIRAAASANGKNKLSIVVPCHRVIGSDGSLIGYGGGLPRKKWLLDHENKFAHGVTTLF
ncbi:MAG TPA: methylated-DNA--[protein]-cysteine S-methyltransferase [Chitinophagaceae bacterium]|nr:methylated-DNA--[protein]-cysteine S-methyltransferase [Chitinophagaceae bacterium]